MPQITLKLFLMRKEYKTQNITTHLIMGNLLKT